ncbi:MAG: hypothetical protein CFE29_15425 [Bradyrhizobiaceae bacterium PARB1]|nr:MAG: hypothetical protein CFE29_15425 [Bradyrhizobiaceae bacterium PARB1]
MNHTYKHIWSKTLGRLVIVPECCKGGQGRKGGKAKLGAAASIAATLLASPALAQSVLPTGGTVVSGAASVATNGAAMTINQSSDKLIANWQSFSVGAGNSVTFNQPGASSVALNRVTGQDASQILGSLSANGQVFLVNPNGIAIGKTGSVQTGGFIASTLGISDANFLAGNYRFTGTSGTITNEGSVSGKTVALISPVVSNSGTITGNTALAAGTDVQLDFNGDGLLSVEVKASTMATLVENKGLIRADGGVAILTAKGASAAMKGVVNNTGTIEANSIGTRNGRILLLGDMQHGEVKAAGKLKAKFVETSAAKVSIDKDLKVDSLGGTWLIDPTDIEINAGNVGGYLSGLATGNLIIQTPAAGSELGNIAINAAMSWTSPYVLTLTAHNNIAINAAITAASGGLTINAPGTITATAGISLGTFVLNSGSWQQTAATLPSFYARDFQLNGGSFLRVTGGDGTSATPYLLTDVYGLQGLSSSLAAYWTLANDIDASGTAAWNSGAGFKSLASFGGTLDGSGHTISGLTMLSAGNIGLFNTIASGGTVKNLNLFDATMTGVGAGGVLVVENGGTVSNVHVSGTLAGSNAVAGLAGHNAGTITASGAAVAVTGTGYYVGGLVGWNSGSIDSSYATGAVSGSDKVGGLVGYNGNHARITQAYATGTVSGSSNVGGLVGYNEEAAGITQSYATGAVSGSDYVGGLVGCNYGTLTQSYATGAVTGSTNVGGLFGINHALGTVTQSFATGAVSGASEVGGLGGYNMGGITQAYWDTQTSGLGVGVGVDEVGLAGSVTGLTTRQLQGLDPVLETTHFSASTQLGSVFSGGADGLYPYLTSFFPNGVQVVSGFAYSDGGATPLASGAAGAVTIALNADGSRIGQATTGANGYYYIVTPIGAPTVSSGGSPVLPINNGQNLLAFTTGSAPAAATLRTASGSSVQTGLNLYGNALTVNTAATLFSQAPQNATEARAQNAAALATAAGNDAAAIAAIDGSVGLGLSASGASFTIDQTPAINGVLAIESCACSPIIVNAPITVASGQGLGLLSEGALAINAPINVNAAGSVALAYDASSLANLSFGLTGTGFNGSVTYLDGNGQPITSDAGGKLSINSNAYTLVYTMAQLDAIDGKEAVGNAGVAIYGSGLSGRYALAGGLDASGVTYTNAIVAGQQYGTQQFSGTLEGLGHSVANLTISGGANSYIGLIGYLTGMVRDIGVVGGSVEGYNNVGGLVGFSDGTVTQSYATGAASGVSLVGGLVGFILNSSLRATVTQSYATGTVSGSTAVGGLVGINWGGTVTQSYATGAVSGSSAVGGLVGINSQGTITRSYATGAVSGSSAVGGLVGANNGGTITQAYATGAVSGSTAVGGLAGDNVYGTITQSYWDTQTSGSGVGIGSDNYGQSGNVTGLTTAQMNNPTTFINAGWDYSSVWGTLKTGGTPVLRALTTDPLISYYVVLSGNTSTTYGDGITSTSGITVGGIDAGNVSVAWGSAIGATTNAGTYGYGATGVLALTYAVGTASDYYIDYGSGALTVNQRIVNLSGNQTYNGTTNVASGNLTLSNLANGETLTLSGFGELASKNVGTGLGFGIGTLALGNGTGLASNYTLTGGTQSIDITKAVITSVSGIVAGNKTYDGSTAVTLDASGVVLNGMAQGDALTLGAGFSGLFSDANAGSNKTVTISGLSLTGADAGNYTLSSSTASTTADIAKAVITSISGITAGNKTYDGTDAATLVLTGATFNGKVAGDVLTVATSSGAFDNKNAGTGKTVNISGLTLGGTDAGNYTLSSTTAATTADIAKAIITSISGITASNRTYDGTDAATLVTSGAVFNGKISGDVLTVATGAGAFLDKGAGTGKTVNITGLTLGGTDAGNYTLSTTTAATTADIAKAVITSITGITATNRTYDGTTDVALVTAGAGFSGKISGDVLTVATASGALRDKNAGTGKTVDITGLMLGGTDAGNYTLSTTTASTTVDIAKAIITSIAGITAGNKTYDGTTDAALVTSGAVFNGKLSGDVLTVAAGTGAFSGKDVGNGLTVGISGLTLGGTDAGNYTLSTTTASTTANIVQRVLSLSGGRVYDGSTDVAANVLALGNLVSGETLMLTGSGQLSSKDAGSGRSFSLGTLALGNGSGLASNYTLAGGTYVVDIAKAVLTLSGFTVANRTYDGTTAAAILNAGTLNGVLGGDNVSFVSAGASFADKNAGTGKMVTLNGGLIGADASNYTLAPGGTTTTADIARAVIASISGVTALSKPYDGSTNATLVTSGAVFNGMVAGDLLRVATGIGTFVDSNSGTGKRVNIAGLSLGGLDAGNYTLASTTTTTTADINASVAPVLPPPNTINTGTSVIAGIGGVVRQSFVVTATDAFAQPQLIDLGGPGNRNDTGNAPANRGTQEEEAN